ncbi:MAG: NAD(P)-dependent alcohol dehydrogenase, partial [Anaerolineales bacterium]|nr:NAD(P)-dependent alcohol dehydrogenase [Anaerolineales bacterium]
MKAIVYTEYGSPEVLQLAEMAKPTPQGNQLLIKIYAAAVNQGDRHILGGIGRMMGEGVFAPKNPRLGADVAGVVEAVGRGVRRFQVGDAVFGDLSAAGRGSFAEYVLVSEDAPLAHKPAEISFEQAAAVPLTAVTALQGLRDYGRIQAGQQVLINGASGGVGTFAVQIAKAFGSEVTGVASTHKLEIVRSLGADRLIDYTQEAFTENGQQYDLIFDTVGNHPLADLRSVLTQRGTYVTTTFMPAVAVQGKWLTLISNQKFYNMMSKPNTA